MSTDQLRAAAGAVAERKGNPIADMQGFLNKHRAQFELALPKHMNGDRMLRLALTAFSSSSKLQQCDPKSFFGAVLIASQMGLEIGVAGQGFIVPYKGKAQFVPGWQGLVDLVARAGRASVWTGAAFDGDKFEWQLGDRPAVHHIPMGEDDPRKMTHVYAVGRIQGSEWPIIEVWPMARIWRHRDRYNKVGDLHYSYENPEMYARKIPLLQVIKYLPKSIELQNALALEEGYERGRPSAGITDGVVTFDAEEVTQPPASPAPTSPPPMSAPPAAAPSPAAQIEPDKPEKVQQDPAIESKVADWCAAINAATSIDEAVDLGDKARKWAASRAMPKGQIAQITAALEAADKRFTRA